MTDALRFKRQAAGHYVSVDGRFRIVRDESVAANMWGAFSEPWQLWDRDRDAGSFGTKREAVERASKRAKRTT